VEFGTAFSSQVKDDAMRVLLTGAGGQIGAALMTACLNRDWIVQPTWYCRPSGGVALDVRDTQAVHEIVLDFQPEVILHAAGLSQMDYAETQPGECHEVTVDGLVNVIDAAERADAAVVTFTSDQVFGVSAAAMNEAAAASPLNVYGRCQAEAESLLQARLPRHLIIRTASVYGPHELPRNPVLHALKRLRDGQGVTAARDRLTQPTFAPDLAKCICDLAEREVTGIVHVVGPERMTESSFLKQAAFIFGLDSDLIAGVPAAALCEDAPRALTPWLCRSKLRTLLGTQPLRPLGEGLRAMKTPAPAYRIAA
jgi:dTDP-4-dehydrorhamnose reductase